MNAGVLPDVESMQVKSERAYLAQQRIQESPGQPLPMMRPETLAYQQQIMFELGCAGVSGGSAWSLPVLACCVAPRGYGHRAFHARTQPVAKAFP